MAYPERIVPDDTEAGVVAMHLKRYEFALPYCDGRGRVLDAACGVGYGTALLATRAAHVLGLDVDAEAIEYARRRYASPTVEFEVMDLLDLHLPESTFDVVCSFETIEHLPRSGTESYLDAIARVLRPGGTFLVSTPNSPVTTLSPPNPHHLVEFSRRDFEDILRARFDDVRLFGQRRLQTGRHRLVQRLDVLGLRRRIGVLRGASRAVLGTAATAELTTDDLVIDAELGGATELVAVCSLAE